MTQRQMPSPSVQYPYPYQPMGMPPLQMPQQKQGFLSKLLGQKNRAPYPFENQTRFPQEMGTNYPQTFQAYPPQRNEQMRNPYDNSVRMNSPIASPTTAAATVTSKGGVGTFFSNLIADPSSMIGNVEKVVKVAQTVGPVVQQYSPLIKNFPNITKLLSSLQKKEDNTSSLPAEKEQEATESKTKPTTKTRSRHIVAKKEELPLVEPHIKGTKPKLYV
ncbi:VrrA/YqfQ family protein [Ectobacillus sp. sgz5001026]|uniref:VrrA/YqfQ family protein n=1 Tax=Ectobacillus sp. sgz5001026 TaxID=3242473 RepID=UPI0036D246BA